MKKLTILFIAFGLLFLGVMNAEALDTGAVAVTVTVSQTLGMTVGPDWAVGSMGLNATKSTWVSATEGYFTLANTGDGTQDYNIKASIDVGSIGATPGTDQYAIGWGRATGDYTSEATYANITTGDLAMIQNMVSGTPDKFDLQLKTPTDTTTSGVQRTITVTITAKAGV